MQDFATAMANLNKVMDAKKKELSEQFRPIFAAYPEIGTVSFEISSQIYDDETYNDGIENVQYTLTADGEGAGRNYVGDGTLSRPSEGLLKTAAGEFSSWERGYGQRYCDERKVEALNTIAEYEEMAAQYGAERMEVLNGALTEIEETIEEIDIEFAKVALGVDVTVTASASGITVE